MIQSTFQITQVSLQSI